MAKAEHTKFDSVVADGSTVRVEWNSMTDPLITVSDDGLTSITVELEDLQDTLNALIAKMPNKYL